MHFLFRFISNAINVIIISSSIKNEITELKPIFLLNCNRPPSCHALAVKLKCVYFDWISLGYRLGIIFRINEVSPQLNNMYEMNHLKLWLKKNWKDYDYRNILCYVFQNILDKIRIIPNQTRSMKTTHLKYMHKKFLFK